jgi:serine/threonine-protein kinase
MTLCPQREELENLLADRLPIDREQHVLAHVDSCRVCERTLEELTVGCTAAASRPVVMAQPSVAVPGTVDDAWFWRWLKEAGPPTDSFPPGQAANGDATPRKEASEDHAVPGGDQPPLAGRYELRGEIGRGGMGAVLRGYDNVMGRELAIKMLLARHRCDPEMIHRFLEEARISGRLQHPGIAPVYEVGHSADERPFFTMKVVEGQTLQHLLRHCADRAHALPRFLAVFAQVCQTMAYAHARGVLHRDLKPSNVMVGAFGEVQVMDWGLAKQIADCGVWNAELKTGAETTPANYSSTPPSALRNPQSTRAGVIVGTPAYMAPEQARGEVDRLDARVDVFGLGAILCEVLTGRPPFDEGGPTEIVARSALGSLGETFARLDGCGADAELIGLAQRCLAADPEERPRDAGEVADAVTRYLAGVQERLQVAERDRAVAQARAAGEHKARLLTTTLGLVAVLAVGLIGLFAWGQQKAQSERDAVQARTEGERAAREAATERDVRAALNRTYALQAQARTLTDNPEVWKATLAAAMAAAREAEGILHGGTPSDQLDEEVRQVLDELQRDDRDRQWVARLDEARLGRAVLKRQGLHILPATDPHYARLFRDNGLDVLALPPDDVARRLGTGPIRERMLEALEDWRRAGPAPDAARRLDEVFRAADPDAGSFRNRWRDALGREDARGLLRLIAEPVAREQPVSVQVMLARDLRALGATSTAERLLRALQQKHPNDFWVHDALAFVLCEFKPPRIEEACRCFAACTILRPESAEAHVHLGAVLYHRKSYDEAAAHLQRAITLNPNHRQAYQILGMTLHARRQLGEAAAAYRKSLEVDPKLADTYNNYGNILQDMGRLDDAIANFQKAIELDPKFAMPHYNLGNARRLQDRFDDAIDSYRTARQLDPSWAMTHINLGGLLFLQGQTDDAIRSLQRGIEVDPSLPEGYVNLSVALCGKGRFDDGISALQQAIARSDAADPRLPQWRLLVINMWQSRDVAARMQEVLQGRAKPISGSESFNFAQTSRNYLRRYAQAVRFYLEAFDDKSDLPRAIQVVSRHEAVGAAAMAGCGQGEDPPKDDAARATLRKQARDWLRADLAFQAKRPPSERAVIRQSLTRWRGDRELASVRDGDTLNHLPEEERKEWRTIWREIDDLLRTLPP